MLHSKKAILLTALESQYKNINFHKWLIPLLFLFSSAVMADTESGVKPSNNVISVSGDAKLVIPADAVEITISASTTENVAKDAEKKGYQVGLKLKKIFNDFGISEIALISSSSQISDSTANEKVRYVFTNTYTTVFKHFDLIDAFRMKCVEAGATVFSIGKLISDKQYEHTATTRNLAYKNAKGVAEATLKDSGFKLGMPLMIEGDGYEYNLSGGSTNTTEGLGVVGKSIEPIESLFQSHLVTFDSRVRVRFQIIE